jgi:hypothetical protein
MGDLLRHSITVADMYYECRARHYHLVDAVHNK